MDYKFSSTEYRCDACGKILIGYDKNVFNSLDYICIKGKLTLQLNDSEFNRRYFVHLIPPARDMITVCDLKCLKVYIDVQHAQYQKNRESRLRNTASRSYPKKLNFHKWTCNCETCTNIRER